MSTAVRERISPVDCAYCSKYAGPEELAQRRALDAENTLKPSAGFSADVDSASHHPICPLFPGAQRIIATMGDKKSLFVSTLSPIAIVGSSGRLLMSEEGETIDKYHTVIRFNRAPTEGYEEHVGSKTTLRVTNNHVFNNNDIEASEGTWGSQPKDFIRDLRNKLILYCAYDLEPWYKREVNTHESNQLFVVDYPMLEYMRRKENVSWDGHLSIGAVIIFLALRSGLHPQMNTDSVGAPLIHLYGFDIMEDVKRTHYWETRPEPQAGNKTHSICAEKSWFKYLIENKFIKYF
jgi:hypothetical protein